MDKDKEIIKTLDRKSRCSYFEVEAETVSNCLHGPNGYDYFGVSVSSKVQTLKWWV